MWNFVTKSIVVLQKELINISFSKTTEDVSLPTHHALGRSYFEILGEYFIMS